MKINFGVEDETLFGSTTISQVLFKLNLPPPNTAPSSTPLSSFKFCWIYLFENLNFSCFRVTFTIIN